jgi:hypothetical protein
MPLLLLTTTKGQHSKGEREKVSAPFLPVPIMNIWIAHLYLKARERSFLSTTTAAAVAGNKTMRV